MITIDQLLESVDLNFEPRFVTRDECGEICITEHKPETYEPTREWVTTVPSSGLESVGKIKLSEFDGKDWTECIYEVPRKTARKIEKFDYPVSSPFYIEHNIIMDKINEIIDWINENYKDTK